MTKDEILAQGLLFFLAAYETTSSAISFLCYLLALNPDVQEKAYKHIVEKMGDKVLYSRPYLVNTCTCSNSPPVAYSSQNFRHNYENVLKIVP